MYPQGNYIDSNYKTLIVFEKDLNNPDNEGFVCYWDIDDQNINKLIFKKKTFKRKSLTKVKKSHKRWLGKYKRELQSGLIFIIIF